MFESLLVANRGEIARRIIRSAADLGIRTIAVSVPADRDAPHVAEADAAYDLPAGGYLDPALLVEIALEAGADAVHPGYGFLSENASFARAVIDAGLVWVGPQPEVIARMGDKIEAKALAEAHDVPTLPSSNDPDHAASVGFPLLVKAAAGGGGKGMRIVESAAGLDDAVTAARREAGTSFGDDRVFLERYVRRARHVEIQILGDHHGNLVHLGERECSIQRRHQKVVEEAPSPRVDPALRDAMGAAALRMASALDYRNAGTVEFLVDDESGAFWFLEVNTRLQVEHPVTEAVTGVDLVRAQLLVASGLALDETDTDMQPLGAAIEVRLYAEDAANGFLPATGRLTAWNLAPAPFVRIDSGVEAGNVVGIDFDPMLAKVIADADTRAEAAGRLALALERMSIAGVVTNRDFLVSVLRSPEFLAGDTTTDFIDRVQPAAVRVRSDADRRALAVAAAMWLRNQADRSRPVLGGVPVGFRNSSMPAEAVTLVDAAGSEVVITHRSRRDGTVEVTATGADDALTVMVHTASDAGVDCSVGRRRLRAVVRRAGDTVHVHDRVGDTEFRVAHRFPAAADETPTGSLTAPMPGKVLEIRVETGDTVEAGQTLVVLEAMKMEHHLTAPTDGTVGQMLVGVGQQVDNGASLLVVESTG